MEKELSDSITKLFNDGLTHQEIGDKLNKPRRTIMHLCTKLGLKRSRAEAASLKIKSPLDNDEAIAFIRENRNKLSLEDIAKKYNSSTSAVQRICNKHKIKLDKDEFCKLQSEKMQKAWGDDKKQVARTKSLELVTPELKTLLSNNSKNLWRRMEYREKQISIQTEVWNRPENKAKLTGWRCSQSGRLSSIQKLLYSILNDLGVEYIGEDKDPTKCIVGPYNFDCIIPRYGQKSLIIECQGDYWHTQDKAVKMDRAKSTYIEKYFNDQYEIKYLWEHEFSCVEKVVESLKYWLNISDIQPINYDFADIDIKRAEAKDYRLLLSKYHYLPNAGKGGTAYGAYVNEELVAVCVFSKLVRQNIQIDGFNDDEVLELSRLCIHPKFRKKNLASWFVSRCIKKLNGVKCIVSYCDTTFNHNGAVYKSLNFVNDKVVRPDYWYTDQRGWIMHKKTLYNKAIKMSMLESEFADKFGYKKIFGKEKLRFVLML